ncbi:MAG: hypothetical protein V8R30_00585 [Clostridia bacterium]
MVHLRKSQQRLLSTKKEEDNCPPLCPPEIELDIELEREIELDLLAKDEKEKK